MPKKVRKGEGASHWAADTRLYQSSWFAVDDIFDPFVDTIVMQERGISTEGSDEQAAASSEERTPEESEGGRRRAQTKNSRKASPNTRPDLQQIRNDALVQSSHSLSPDQLHHRLPSGIIPVSHTSQSGNLHPPSEDV